MRDIPQSFPFLPGHEFSMGGNIYPAKGWRLVPIVFKLLRGGKIISPFFFFFFCVQSTDIHFVVVAQLLSRV